MSRPLQTIWRIRCSFDASNIKENYSRLTERILKRIGFLFASFSCVRLNNSLKISDELSQYFKDENH